MSSRPSNNDDPFWRRKSLREMTAAEWESLCDGCGRCCLIKLRDTVGEVFTDVCCKLLDTATCRCSDYSHRQEKVKDCLKLSAQNIKRTTALPPTCAYRLIAEGRDLYWWHHLVSGDRETVHQAGISVQGRVISEVKVKGREYDDHIVHWPARVG